MTYALRDVTLNQTDPAAGALAQPWRFIGTDLDRIRTDVVGGPNGCLVPTNPDGGGPSSIFPIDGNAGVDNQFGAQVSGVLLPVVAPNLQPTACCEQRFGRGTLLVHIQNWNGMPDDAHVSIGITTTFDGTSDDPAGS